MTNKENEGGTCKCVRMNGNGNKRYHKLIHMDEDIEWWACIACYDTWFIGECEE